MSPYNYCANNPIVYKDPDGREWTYFLDSNGNGVIHLNLNFIGGDKLSANQITNYKNLLLAQLNDMVSRASGGKVSASITFHDNNSSITPRLELSEMDPSLGGMTSYDSCSVNVSSKVPGELRDINRMAEDGAHELLHTLRLDHPFERTQTEDTKLIKTGPNCFLSTNTTDSNIVNNIMNYYSTYVDGKKSVKQDSITKGQLDFMIKEIKLQMDGYGRIPKSDPNLTSKQNANNAQKYYYDYYDNTPGTPIE